MRITLVSRSAHHVGLIGPTRHDMAWLKFSCTPGTGWHKNLLPFVLMACIGFAGSSAAAPAQPAPGLPVPFACGPGEASVKDARRINDHSAGGLVELAAPLRADGPPTAAEIFQAGIDDAAREVGNEPRLRRLTPQQRRARAEFVFGNMLFVTIHELGHALVSELDLMVLGREEDVADAYATVGVIKCGSDFSRRVLVEAAKGWFMTAQRGRKAGEVPQYYERHGLDEQRAYQIVCLMVGSDPVRFKDLADEAGLPEERRRSCSWDYDTASRSWERALAPHQRASGQPKPRIEVIYGEAKGKLARYAHIFRTTRFLETVIEQIVDRFAWPAPIVVEMRSCGEPNARWTIPTRTLHVCYELAQEFVELHRDFGGDRTLAQLRLTPGKRPTVRPQNIAQAIGAWKRLHGSGAGRRSGR
jgi:Putative metallopeptidase